MRYLHVSIAVPAFLVLLSMFGANYGRPGHPQGGAQPQKPIVIVELFTSEGCSSCPPADELLKKITEQQPLPGVEVVALEEHVDYWNHDRWTDPFSSPEFTERQVVYSHVLPKSGVYTPETIVDGYEEIEGTHPQKVVEAIQQAASTPKADVTLSPSAENGPAKVSFTVKVGHLPAISKGDELELWVAVTERGLQSDVKAGENSGKTLPHAAVVRSLRKVGSTKNGTEYVNQFTVKREKNWNRENLAVVAFVVDKNSHKIVGAGIAPVA
jgi:hypothetical protein